MPVSPTSHFFLSVQSSLALDSLFSTTLHQTATFVQAFDPPYLRGKGARDTKKTSIHLKGVDPSSGLIVVPGTHAFL